MKRTLLLILSVALLSSTGCGPFSCFHRGDRCQQPCSMETGCNMNQMSCHSGVLGGTIVGDDGIPTIIEGSNPGALPRPVAEGVGPGRVNP